MRSSAAIFPRVRSSCGCRRDAVRVESRSSGRPPRSTTFSAARSRTCRSTATGAWCSARPRSSSPKRRRRFSGRWPSRPTASIYVGSGNEGKVFKIDAAGKAETFFDTTELEVHALVLAPDGSLYAATSPEGRIYKIDRTGKGAPFFDPEDKYIWSLALDATGNLYAGTGEKGLIYKITPDGKGTPFYATKATHVIALTFERNGQLLAGTEGPGRLVPRRLDRQGVPPARLDAPGDSRHPPRSAGQHLPRGADRAHDVNEPAAGVIDTRDARPPSAREPIPTVTTEVTAIAVVDTGGASVGSAEAPAREDRRGGRGAIYRIRPDGLWDILWESAEDSPYDLTFDSSGALIVGTGRNGKLYSLSGEPTTATLLMQASAQQVTGFARDSKGNVIYATSNPGKDLQAVAAARGRRHVHVARARRADGGRLGHAQLARVRAGGRPRRRVHAIGQHRDARRYVERLERTVRRRERRRNQEPERAVPAVEGRAGRKTEQPGPDVGIGRLRAAQPAAEGDEPDGASRGHGVSEALSHRRSRTSPGSTTRRPIAAF